MSGDQGPARFPTDNLDWRRGARFRVHDDPDPHGPTYVIMPCGGTFTSGQHNTPGVDQGRAQFITDACNAALDVRERTQVGGNDAALHHLTRCVSALDQLKGDGFFAQPQPAEVDDVDDQARAALAAIQRSECGDVDVREMRLIAQSLRPSGHSREDGVCDVDCRKCRHERLMVVIEALVALRQDDGWVSCAERLPEVGYYHVIGGSFIHSHPAFYDDRIEGWISSIGAGRLGLLEPQPTHWRPLPNPPMQGANPC